ncbi:UDP-N-acetylmuramoyl-L-alanyl-D-glutamate--2,6-diaminopimelate ligase [Herbaspirillum sp. RTI4]|uniref:UDP-N-acetylmuramoyl-L-alanyl-D-glutamate--2, 6-diaminopimelate ligase n=1 Tax=Herbaspirillum sp. RTI4 TaxID=3048640 RepID=UPI002AB57B71|nr:UDP-N-acetylmuramoyl-L-alanyl-D-glutamate--2,6-diaminopimelate ligase [Herbaspirillum sp. RTI4]MDY7577473.1 UDP-N-acetylmuramoyl-L-alanyl-D-glutamate--2,6-diaminopimelate ligase [Herbaspirillum sp. RTI4]MEA9981749.1 UDP-N-acetylmuramoyl-L-alanyl-D-glutamate--2,6-diaminopimelate ligase [Herbaspirillum sp. RTI4]
MNKAVSTANEILNWLQSQRDAGASEPQCVPQLSADSRRISAGDIFFAYPGDEADGRRYIADAIERGAAAIVYEAADFVWDAALDLPMPLPRLAVQNLKQLAGPVGSAYYGHPDSSLFTVAVTGTNGKTSCAWWLGAALSKIEGAPSAVIGTFGAGLFREGASQGFAATGYTTPDALLLQQQLDVLARAGATSLAIEASSIGLHQGRMSGLHVDVALFTNFTRDHLDYHGDMDAYESAKSALFDWPGLRQAVINSDDPMGQRLIARLAARGLPLIAYSIGPAAGIPETAGVQQLRASAIRSGPAGTSFHVESPFGNALVKTQLVGLFNVSNVLGVLGVLLARGVAWDAALVALAALTPVPGRMQQAGGQEAPLVVIDYAHTPDALEKALAALRQIAAQRGGQLWCMFGCGGGRDSGKRAAMGQAAMMADRIVLTNDNPRYEDPAEIITQIQSGISGLVPHVMADRAAAILWTIRHAGKHDVVLLAGKGHENYQEFNGKKLPFLDADHAALALAARVTMGGAI